MPSHFLISWLISWFPGWFVPGKTTQKPPHRPPHKPPDEEAPSMWLLGFSVSQSAGSREAPEGSWNDPRVEAPPSTPGGAVFVFKKNTAKTTQSGKIYITGGFWFPKKKTFHWSTFGSKLQLTFFDKPDFQISTLWIFKQHQMLACWNRGWLNLPFSIVEPTELLQKNQHPWKWSLQHFNIF